MSRCPLFTPNVETVGIVDKANCGECGRWDGEAEKCRDEEKLRELLE